MAAFDLPVNDTGLVHGCVKVASLESKNSTVQCNGTSNVVVQVANRSVEPKYNSTVLHTSLVTAYTPAVYTTVINITLPAANTAQRTPVSPSIAPSSTPSLATTMLSTTTSKPNGQGIVIGCSVGIGVLAAVVGLLSFLLWRRRQKRASNNHSNNQEKEEEIVTIAGRPYSERDDDEEVVPVISRMGPPPTSLPMPAPVPPLPSRTFQYEAYGPAKSSDAYPHRASSSVGSAGSETAVRDFGALAGPGGRRSRMYRGNSGSRIR